MAINMYAECDLYDKCSSQEYIKTFLFWRLGSCIHSWIEAIGLNGKMYGFNLNTRNRLALTKPKIVNGRVIPHFVAGKRSYTLDVLMI